MTKQEYLEKRKAAVEAAQALINEGKLEESNAKMAEIDDLDKEWEKTAQALADLRALSDNQPAVDVENVEGIEASGKTVEKVNFAPIPAKANDPEALVKSDEYVNAWAKLMMGKQLSDNEQAVVDMVNAYTHTTGNTGAVIPETVAQGIWDMVEEMYPIWADAQKTYVKGTYTVPVSDTSSAAAWYDEATATADGTEAFRSVTLTGCELARAITVSWKLREMAVEDFIPFIQRKLAQKMGAALGYGVSNGKGQPGVGDSFKPEPMGIVTALNAETSTPQVVEYDPDDGVTYADLTTQRSKISVGTNALAYYANAATIWTVLANVKDQNGRPIMIADPSAGGINRIFGIPVKEEDSMTAGDVLLGAPGVGYIANVNKDMSLQTEEHAKARTADYCAYAIVDGNVLSTKAFALLTVGE